MEARNVRSEAWRKWCLGVKWYIDRIMQKQGKILIIDDNEDILFALNLLLKPHVEKVKVTTSPKGWLISWRRSSRT